MKHGIRKYILFGSMPDIRWKGYIPVCITSECDNIKMVRHVMNINLGQSFRELI